MRNLKHTIVALVAVSLVGSLAAHQASTISAVTATKLTRQIESVPEVLPTPAVLLGDGDGVTEDYSLFSSDFLNFAGKDAYI